MAQAPTDPPLLHSSPEEGARLLALRYLADARTAAAQFGTKDGEHALHDLRVALRRLRTVLRIYRGPLDASLSRKRLRALRAFRRATGTGRDLEVLRALVGRLGRGQRPLAPGVRWLCAELEAPLEEARAELQERLTSDFAPLAQGLEDDLRTLRLERRLGEPTPSFADHARAQLALHREQLAAQLGRVSAPTDVAPAHAARIAGKRLRYLLEGLASEVEGTPRVIRELKGLQDLLGELHDLHVLIGVLGQAQGGLPPALEPFAAAELPALRFSQPPGAKERAALLALGKLAARQARALFAATKKAWLGGNAKAFFGQLDALTQRLGAPGGEGSGPPEEIERKFLLRRLPPRVRKVRPLEIAQGWIPGEQLHERLRKVHYPDGSVKCFRTVKLGKGLRRIEMEEETPLPLFSKLWPLTRGKRVEKQRYAIDDGELTWEVDAFTDRKLFLAEVELPSLHTQAPLPSWLRPHVIREVTDEDTYVNLKLAR